MMTTVTTDREDDDGVVPLMDSEELDVLAVQLLGRAETGGLELLGPGGVLTELTKRVLEKGLAVELTDHLGYEKGDPAGWGSGNNRNGTSPKTLLTDAGSIPLDVPRDRNGTFDPRMVPKGERRLQGFNELVTALVARGLSVRDVQAHLQEIYGVEISPELVSKITDAIIPELRAWQSRPLDPVYPILYLDALVVKVRNDHTVVNKAAHIALGVDIDGRRHVLGVWLQREEGAKFWLGVLTELKNRGVQDVLIACCDGLTGFPDAIEAVWPQATVQTCVVHLIRNSTRFVSYKDRRAVVAALKPVYQAPTLDAAAGTGTGSHRSSSSPPRSARSSTRPTPSSRSTTGSGRSPRPRATSRPTTPSSSSSTSPSATSAPPAKASSGPAPTAGNKHSTRSPSPSPEGSPSTRNHQPHTRDLTGCPPGLHYLPGNRRPYRQRRILGR